MLGRQKPRLHPRSLDALFPRPAIKRCPAGHSQTPDWKPQRGCSTCRKAEEERTDERRNAARVERETELAKLTRLPDPYVLTDYHGRVVGRFRAGGRGPGQRRRVKRGR
jgi:hypothetical protein